MSDLRKSIVIILVFVMCLSSVLMAINPTGSDNFIIGVFILLGTGVAMIMNIFSGE